MTPLDRISQLSAEVSRLQDENLILRSQLRDGQEQAKRDSETIARLAKDCDNLLLAISYAIAHSNGHEVEWGARAEHSFQVLHKAIEALSRHA